MREELDSTTRALIAADEAHLGALSDGALWERRSLLQTLARTELARRLVEAGAGLN